MTAKNMGRLRILFAGSPAIALPSLEKIAEAAKPGRWVLAGVLTNPDKRKGRGNGTEPSEVGRRAESLAEEFTAAGLNAPAILKFETLKAPARAAVSELKPDVLISFAYGRIFGPQFMSLFPLGGINVHPSLLPKYRGASPIQETILHRDKVAGISIQRIAPEMDTGNILAQAVIPLNGRETTASLGNLAAIRGAELLIDVLGQFEKAELPEGIPQQGEPSYCTVLEKSSGLVDWNRSAPEIDAHIRACNPWPLAHTTHNGQLLNILEATPYSGAAHYRNDSAAIPNVPPDPAGSILGIDKKSGILVQTGDGILAITLLQYQNKKILPWQAFLNGARDFIGSRFSILV
ncbi:MAG: methionyl-tRNA formyltransferase [Treponema sp.]|nr:methionyl-tRNA formyltransferase [Treponema sp.]